jgi:glutathione synthase/RimK-type ligase-like ATP-grasp enzyme
MIQQDTTMKKTILFINGVGDDRQVTVLGLQKNGALIYSVSGSSNIGDYLPNDTLTKKRITLDAGMKQNIILDDVDVIFNQISDPDTHSVTLAKVDLLYGMYQDKIRFFNLPKDIRKTSRDRLYHLLKETPGLNIPKTVKIHPHSSDEIYRTLKDEGFEFPVIFRQAGDHGGISTIRIDDENEHFSAFALDGRAYYLTQFIDYAEEGVYKKYRLIVIEGKVYLRHVLFGSQWMMHAKSQFEKEISDPYKQDISKRFVKEIKPKIQPTVKKIHDAIGLDYFGIDCHIDENGTMLIFEINANMNIFIDLEGSYFKKHTDRAKQALVKMITA